MEGRAGLWSEAEEELGSHRGGGDGSTWWRCESEGVMAEVFVGEEEGMEGDEFVSEDWEFLQSLFPSVFLCFCILLL